MTVYNIVTTLIPRPSRLALLRMVTARQAQSPAYATGWRNSRVLLPVPCTVRVYQEKLRHRPGATAV
jgi:hypothetical protein